MMTLFTFKVIKILLISSLTSLLAFFWAPILIKFLNKIKFWKKEARTKTILGEEAKIFHSLHQEREITVPRGGGVVIWISVLLVIFLFFGLSFLENPWWLKKFNFLSRKETWLPLFALIAGSLVGLADDILTVFGKGRYVGGGMKFRLRMLIVILIGLIGGWWFWHQLQWNTIHLPLLFHFPEGIDLFVGVWIIPIFVLVTLACWSGGVVDGLDGLSGGIFASIFGAFSIIAFSQGKIDLAAFCGAVSGTLFAFLWYNIPPARFYMGETGILGLTTTLTVVAFLTDSVLVLPIIGLVLVMESGSVILQLLSKKIRHKKIFLVAPLHHHFEAKDWPSYKVVMRFWIISFIAAILGVVIRLM